MNDIFATYLIDRPRPMLAVHDAFDQHLLKCSDGLLISPADGSIMLFTRYGYKPMLSPFAGRRDLHFVRPFIGFDGSESPYLPILDEEGHQYVPFIHDDALCVEVDGEIYRLTVEPPLVEGGSILMFNSDSVLVFGKIVAIYPDEELVECVDCMAGTSHSWDYSELQYSIVANCWFTRAAHQFAVTDNH